MIGKYTTTIMLEILSKSFLHSPRNLVDVGIGDDTLVRMSKVLVFNNSTFPLRKQFDPFLSMYLGRVYPSSFSSGSSPLTFAIY